MGEIDWIFGERTGLQSVVWAEQVELVVQMEEESEWVFGERTELEPVVWEGVSFGSPY